MADRPGDPVRNRATLAATKALAHACCGDRDEAVACAQTAEALYDLATTQDLLAEALRVGLEEREALRAERDAERLNATGFRLLLLGDYAALGRALGLGSAPLTIDQATEAARALLVERNALRAAIATQAAAVRQHDAAQATLRAADARDTATLRRREATPGDTLSELAAAREEARRWNARATELEAERDALRAAVARVTAELHKQQHGEECPRAEHEECREMTDYDEPGHPNGWRCYQGLERAECERERVTCTCGLDALWRAVEVSHG